MDIIVSNTGNGFLSTYQKVIWTSDGLLLTGHWGQHFEIWMEIQTFSLKKISLSEIWIKIQTFSLKKINLEMFQIQMVVILFRPFGLILFY